MDRHLGESVRAHWDLAHATLMGRMREPRSWLWPLRDHGPRIGAVTCIWLKAAPGIEPGQKALQARHPNLVIPAHGARTDLTRYLRGAGEARVNFVALSPPAAVGSPYLAIGPLAWRRQAFEFTTMSNASADRMHSRNRRYAAFQRSSHTPAPLRPDLSAESRRSCSRCSRSAVRRNGQMSRCARTQSRDTTPAAVTSSSRRHSCNRAQAAGSPPPVSTQPTVGGLPLHQRRPSRLGRAVARRPGTCRSPLEPCAPRGS